MINYFLQHVDCMIQQVLALYAKYKLHAKKIAQIRLHAKKYNPNKVACKVGT